MCILWVGIGCKKQTSRELIELAITEVFRENHLSESAIAGIATIDSKASEVGLLELCQTRNLPLKTFSAEVLQNISVPNPSQLVSLEVGTASVAEAAAIRASLDFSHAEESLRCEISLRSRKWCFQSRREEEFKYLLIISKQVFRSSNPNLNGMVTVAVAMSKK
jgi:Cobalamin synthesis G C-terminus